jgi:hypothetical protein
MILHRLKDRAVGLLMLLLALPMCVPNVPGVSTVFGVLIIAPALQLIFGGDKMWLPRGVRAWSVPRAPLQQAIRAAVPTLQRVERYVRPQWSALARGPATQALGWQTLAMALVLMLPIPGGNWPPGMTVAATGLALAQRDGRLALISVPMAAISIGVAWLGFRIGLAALGAAAEFIERALGLTAL